MAQQPSSLTHDLTPGRIATLAARHPIPAILLLIAAQQVLTFWARDLWWSDEVRQADALQNLLDHGHWIALRLNDIPYPDKPPIYFWLLAGLATLFGSDAPPVVFFGLALTVGFFACSVYAMARMIADSTRIALLGTTIPCTGSYFLFLSHYARMDFLFAGFIALAWGCFWRGARIPTFNRWIVLGFTAAAAATMTKGPFGFLLPLGALVFYLGWARNLRRLVSVDVLLGVAILVATILAWIGGIALTESVDYVRFIFSDQIVARTAKNASNPLNYLLYLVLLPALFLPWTLVAVTGRSTDARAMAARDRSAFLWSTALSGLLILSLVGEKHDYYLLPLFAPLGLVCAARIVDLSAIQFAALWQAISIALALIAVLLALVPLFLPYSISLAGVLASSAVLLVTAAALWRVRAEGLRPALLAIVIGQTIWINVVALAVLPSLDPVMSPRPLAEAMRPLVLDGYEPATFAMTGGDLAYHLDLPYREAFVGAEDLARWLETRESVVLATPVAAWDRLPHEELGLREFGRVGLAGDLMIVGIKGPGR